ncbi:MAG: dTDP-4-dehydrorhamnose 3,5-epimerase [Syntrophaceae bacterium]
MPFRFNRLEIPDVILIEPVIFPDGRGFFMETYKHSDFYAFGIRENFDQDNHSSSAQGVLRGLHYQKAPMAQGKLIRCIQGAIFDVAVDIRQDSPTFGRWISVELSAGNRQMLYVPPGFAHGFMVISDMAEIQYKCTREYSPQDEGGIIWNDPDIGIAWPLKDPMLSAKDKLYPGLKEVRLD